ncbi:MAG: DUF4886 domain-containing protein [Bacteroidales bacterium]|nr:DUF4886 domain-containing protein [Bacteroidales bacterium]
MIKLLLFAALMCACDSNSPLEGHYPGGNHSSQTSTETGPATDPDPQTGTAGEFEGRKPLDGKTWKVLFMGNSLTLDATYLLPSLLNAAGVKNVELARTFHGAYTLSLYNSNYSNANICSFSTWKPGQSRWRGEETLQYSPGHAVEAEAYDIICIQEYTGVKDCWSWTSTESANVTGLISKIRASQKLKGNDDPLFVYLFSTQFGRGQERLAANFSNDPVAQFNANTTTISELLAATGIKTVISTGALQQNFRTTGLNTERDMTRGDQVHADYGFVRYAQACLIFKTLFTPITGIKIEDIPFTIEEYYPYPTLHTTPVNDANRPVMLAAINAAYEHPMSITDLSSFSVSPSYTHKPGTLMLDESDFVEPVSFPVRFPLGHNVNDSYTQPFWSGYGIWVCRDQPQAYLKWNYSSYYYTDVYPARTFANGDSATSPSSPSLRGLWTDDWFEFVIPVKNFAAGTKVRFSAPFYTRQGPVFWAFEWLDGDTWKNDCHDITKDGFSRSASFALNAGTTNVSCTATFENGLPEGKLRFRVRVVDGSIQADSATLKAVSRPGPNRTDDQYSSVFYFHDPAAASPAIVFEIL